jgi:hypothetical protein
LPLAGAGGGKTDGVAAAAVVAAVVVVATYCGSTAAATLNGGSPVAADVPPVTLGALDERLLVGTAASDLSALAGARGGGGAIGAALSTRRQEFERQPFETRASGEATTYLKVEKLRFLFLKDSPDAVVAAGVAATALPDASAARAGASATRAVPSVDHLVAGASAPAPGTCSSAASAALGEGGAGSYLSGGPAPHRSPPPLPLPTTSTPRSSGERVLATHAAGIPRPSAPGAPAAGSCAPSCASPAPAPAAAPRARAQARGMGGSDHAMFTVTLCWEE